MSKVLWEAQVCETFTVVRKTGNERDRHVMAVYRDEEPGIITATCLHLRSAESNKSLNVEIKLNSLSDIRGYLFNFGTGVFEN